MSTVITIGDRVQLKRDNLVGVIRFIGEIEGKNEIFHGVELDKNKGDNDGSIGTLSYFKCKPNRGLFVKRTEINKIITRNKENIPRVTVGDNVEYIKAKCDGNIKFIGTPYPIKKNGIYYGIALDEANGKNNGRINGRYFFKCKQERIGDFSLKYGIFVKKDGFTCKQKDFVMLLCFGYIRRIQNILYHHLIIPSEIINICFSYFKKNNCHHNILCNFISDFETFDVLYQFEFGDVKLVFDPVTNKSFALKSFNKSKIIKASFQKYIVNEKNIMRELNHIYIVNLLTTFKESNTLYLAIDPCLDGNLLTLLRCRRYFNEPTARFYAACCIEAISYLHSKNIIYNNLAPENILLDSDGYIKLSGFAFSFQLTKDENDYLIRDNINVFDFVKVPDYAAPETIRTDDQHPIGKTLDWYRLGILIYEMCASFPPFVADEALETFRKIIRARIRFPMFFSQEMRDLIRGLLYNKPQRRLGNLKGGVDDIKQHVWFKGFQWKKCIDRTLIAPILNGNGNIDANRGEMIKNYYIQENVDDLEETTNVDAAYEFDNDW